MPVVYVQQSVVSSVYACVMQWSNCVGRNVNTDVIVMIVKIVRESNSLCGNSCVYMRDAVA